MLNLIMTHSSRMAAITTNKRLGEEVLKDPAVIHRLAWLGRSPRVPQNESSRPVERTFRERTA